MLQEEMLSSSLDRQGSSALSTSLSATFDVSRKGCLKGGMSRSWSSSSLSRSPSQISMSLRDGAQQAYARLLQGNFRVLQGEAEQASNASSEEDSVGAPKTPAGRPLAVVIVCGDSAFEPEAVFDLPAQDLVVIRVDGLLANGVVMKRLQAAIVGQGVRLVIVLSHSSCPAVKACLERWLEQNSETPGSNFKMKQTTTSSTAEQTVGRFACFGGGMKTPVKAVKTFEKSTPEKTPDEQISRSPVPPSTPPIPVPSMAPVSPHPSSSMSSETSLPSASDLSMAVVDEPEIIKHPIEHVVRIMLPCVEKVAVTRVKQTLAKHAEARNAKDKDNKYYMQAPVSSRRARALRLQAIDCEPETIAQVGQTNAATSAQALLKALVGALDPAIARELEVVSAHLDAESGQFQPLKRGWWAHHTYYYEALGSASARQLMSASSGDLDALFGAAAGRRFTKSQYKALGGLPFGSSGSNNRQSATTYALNSMMY